jgi:hypothetical protein
MRPVRYQQPGERVGIVKVVETQQVQALVKVQMARSPSLPQSVGREFSRTSSNALEILL